MNDHVLSALFVIGVWWLSTGLILAMVWLRRSTFHLSFALFSALGIAAGYGLATSRELQTREAAYQAFLCALTLWGWNELLFLQGVLTGPRRDLCPPHARGWQRFSLATQTVIYHELSLVLTLGFIAAVTWNAPNPVAVQTFAVLWVMRLSSKFNLFLGVRHVSEEFIPEHLAYLPSYFRKARWNPLMPLSLLGAGAVVWRLFARSLAPGASGFEVVSVSLVGALLALAVLEHVFLAFPVPDALLWRWAIHPKKAASREPSVSVTDFQESEKRNDDQAAPRSRGDLVTVRTHI